MSKQLIFPYSKFEPEVAEDELRRLDAIADMFFPFSSLFIVFHRFSSFLSNLGAKRKANALAMSS